MLQWQACVGSFEKQPKVESKYSSIYIVKRTKNNESDAHTSSSNVETNDDEERPLGQKASKAQLKRKEKAKETAKKGVEDWHGI